jgi:hypothetical protein
MMPSYNSEECLQTPLCQDTIAKKSLTFCRCRCGHKSLTMLDAWLRADSSKECRDKGGHIPRTATKNKATLSAPFPKVSNVGSNQICTLARGLAWPDSPDPKHEGPPFLRRFLHQRPRRTGSAETAAPVYD